MASHGIPWHPMAHVIVPAFCTATPCRQAFQAQLRYRSCRLDLSSTWAMALTPTTHGCDAAPRVQPSIHPGGPRPLFCTVASYTCHTGQVAQGAVPQISAPSAFRIPGGRDNAMEGLELRHAFPVQNRRQLETGSN